MSTDWSGKRVVILGGARQGLALARWLSAHGAQVVLSDKRSEAEMAAARAGLNGLSIGWALGGHPLELLDRADVLCLSGGVPTTLPIVQEAIRRGLPLSNDTQIFMEAVPCRTVGITGSAGKTTTTTLVGNMARASHADGHAYVGGNIGDPLISYVDEMKPEDLAILEISSFQLEQMTISPNVAAILNITPNHLDRHGSMEAYTVAKSRLLVFQSPKDIAVLGRDDPGAWALRARVKGQLHSFGFSPMTDDAEGTYYDSDGLLVLYEHRVDIPLLRRDQVHLRGEHNLMNVLAAFAIGHAAGLPLDAMLTAAEEFSGVPHRLELVTTRSGVCWYNDSIATAPERTIAAIRSFEEPIVLLLGGRDKKLPWEDLAKLVHARVDHVIIFGEAADKIEAALRAVKAERPRSIKRVGSLHEAVLEAAKVAEPGDVVLLSPGGTSFDEFRDFEERGERYRLWVQELS